MKKILIVFSIIIGLTNCQLVDVLGTGSNVRVGS